MPRKTTLCIPVAAVRALTPALELGILMLSPYARPRGWEGIALKVAQQLVKRGYLEEKDGLFRCTDVGEEELASRMRGRL